ncbi:MAG: hypothetical protein ACRCYS_02580 [Beijerinckiaceae bacterium]
MRGLATPKDPVHRLLAVNLASGVAIGLGATFGVYSLNVGGIQQLVAQDSSGWIALLLMAVGFVVTCGSLAMGSAVMLMPRDERKTPPPGGIPQHVVLALAPVRIRQTATGSSRSR